MDGAPRFRIEIDEVKKRELDGFSGVVAKILGQYFDELVTQIASGRASRLNKRLNDEILKRVGVFKEYGVFQRIDYAPSEVVLHFDLTRFRPKASPATCSPRSGRGPSPSIAGSIPGWLPLLHDHSQRTRSAQLGQRRDLLPRLRPSCRPKQSRFTAGATGATTSSRSQPTARTRPAAATGRRASPATSTAIQAGNRAALPLLRPGPASALLHTPPACRIREVDVCSHSMTDVGL